MTSERSRPSAVVLDLLRSAHEREQSAQTLIGRGAVFGFAENTVRVTLSRLVARGLVESPERGRYRLAPRTDPLNDFVERWRLGEARVRPWQAGEWLLAHPQGDLARSHWALDALGFREVRSGLWARPDNLAMTLAELQRQAVAIGFGEDVLLVQGSPAGETIPASWLPAWHPDQLDETYEDGLRRLEASAARLPGMPRRDAMLESFTLGGEMVHRLAKDPLLPAAMVDVAARARLCAAMLEYDALGRRIWADGGEDVPVVTPRPQLLQVR